MAVVVDEVLRAEVIRRHALDQEIRRTLGTAEALSPEHLRRMADTDADNSGWLRDVLARHGWPGRSVVGDDGAHAAWQLAQHADRHPDLQRECLDALGEAARRGDASLAHLAYLTDRVLSGRGEPQLYGTQFWYGPDGRGALRPKPISDPEHLEERRAAAGLEPFAEYAEAMRRRS
jgi:hypothetical protein